MCMETYISEERRSMEETVPFSWNIMHQCKHTKESVDKGASYLLSDAKQNLFGFQWETSSLIQCLNYSEYESSYFKFVRVLCVFHCSTITIEPEPLVTETTPWLKLDLSLVTWILTLTRGSVTQLQLCIQEKINVPPAVLWSLFVFFLSRSWKGRFSGNINSLRTQSYSQK